MRKPIFAVCMLFISSSIAFAQEDRKSIYDDMSLCALLAQQASDNVGAYIPFNYEQFASNYSHFVGEEIPDTDIAFKTIAYTYTTIMAVFRNADLRDNSAEIDAFKMSYRYCQELSGF